MARLDGKLDGTRAWWGKRRRRQRRAELAHKAQLRDLCPECRVHRAHGHLLGCSLGASGIRINS